MLCIYSMAQLYHDLTARENTREKRDRARGRPDLLIEPRGLCAVFSQELTQGFKHSCVIPDTLLVEGHTFTILPT